MSEVARQPKLETDRLILRPFVPDDAPAVQAMCSAFEIADTTLSIPHPYPEEAAPMWIDTHAPTWEEGTGVTYAVTNRADGTLIGAIGLSLAREHARAEMGYWIAVPRWGQGYCTEAGRALLAFAFDVMGIHRVQARHFVRNPASGRVMQKLGMRLEGVHRGAMKKWDVFEDLAVYAVLADEWREIAVGAAGSSDATAARHQHGRS